MTDPRNKPNHHQLDMRAIVRAGQWGVEIEGEIATSKVLPKMRELAQANFESHMDALLDAIGDQERRELQLAARSFKNVLDFLDEVEGLSKEAIANLEMQQSIDTAALEQPDT